MLAKDEIERTNELLEAARVRSGARGSFIFDFQGYSLAHSWADANGEVAAALAAANVAASFEVMRPLTDRVVSDLRLQSQPYCIDMKRVRPFVFLGTVYSLEQTTHDMVALHFAKTIEDLAPILDHLNADVESRRGRRDDDEPMGRGARLRPGDPPRRTPPSRGGAEPPPVD
jgi:hypothetical protein